MGEYLRRRGGGMMILLLLGQQLYHYLVLYGTTNEHKSVQTEVAQVNIHLVLVVDCVD